MNTASMSGPVLALLLLSAWGCGGGSLGNEPPSECRPIFAAARDPALYVHHDDQMVLLFPEEGMRLGSGATYLVAGRAFGDFSGGIEVNGEPAQVTGNGFHRAVPDQGDEVLDILVVARGADGEVTSTAQRSVVIDPEVDYGNGVALTWHVFRPMTTVETFRDLLKASCVERLIFLMWHAKTPSSDMQEEIRNKGLLILGYLQKSRIVVADRQTVLSLTDQFIEDAGILWMGPLVPQMKYHEGVFDGLTDVDLDTLQLGQSIAGVPAVTFGGSSETLADAAALVSLMDDHAVWQHSMSDTFVNVVLELHEMRWMLEEPLVQYVERMTPTCPGCEGCPCDTSACATAGVICPVLFGEEAVCQSESCVIP